MLGHLQAGPTASRPTYNLLQVLRAIAALMVVLHHETLVLWDRLGLQTVSHNWINGGSGVDIFFVISGFVMTTSAAPLRHAEHPARTFLARRLERIVPMYWLLTTVKVLLVLAVPASAVNGFGSWMHVLCSYLFLPSISGAPTAEPILVVGWTLNFEMAFYLLFAIALWSRKSLLQILAPALFGIVLVSKLWLGAPWLVHWYGNTLVLEFLFGVLLAQALPWVKRLPRFVALLIGLAAWVPLLFYAEPNFSPWRCIGWGIPALAVVTSALALESWLGFQSPRWLVELGDASYSIYLVHGFILPLVAIVLAHTSTAWPGVVPVTLALMLLLATLSGEVVYRLLERPITEYFKGQRRTAIPASN